MPYSGRTQFRATRGLLSFVIALSAVVLAVSIVSSIYEAELWVVLSCWAFFLVCLAGIVELLSSHVTLDESHFRMRKNFRTTVVARDTIASVVAEKGCPITLLLEDGSRIAVPDLGGQSIDNSIRAWAKATR